MLNISGMPSIVKNAGTAISGSLHWISPAAVIIMLPTTINAGAVADDGMAPASGATKSAIAKSNPVTMAVTPERPPAATPGRALDITDDGGSPRNGSDDSGDRIAVKNAVQTRHLIAGAEETGLLAHCKKRADVIEQIDK